MLVQRNVVVAYDGVKTFVHLDRLHEVQLFDLASSRLTTVDLSDHNLVLVVFLSAADCWSCMGELPGWKSLAEGYPTNVLGEVFVFIRSRLSEVSTVVSPPVLKPAAFDLSMVLNPNTPFAPRARIYLDTTGRADRLLGLPLKTPLTVLIEGKTRRVILAEGADTSPQWQDRFIGLVREAVHGQSQRGQTNP
jgi:hypothetical protein